MTLFFFYHYLKKEDLIKELDETCTIQNGYIYIESFHENINQLNINKDSNFNKERLDGKLTYFPHKEYKEIVEKLGILDKIKYKNKSHYTIDEVNVYLNKEKTKKAYIIY